MKPFSGRYLCKSHKARKVTGSQQQLTVEGSKLKIANKTKDTQITNKNMVWEIDSQPQTPDTSFLTQSPIQPIQTTRTPSPIVIAGEVDVPDTTTTTTTSTTTNNQTSGVQPIQLDKTIKKANTRKRVRKTIGGQEFQAQRKKRLHELNLNKLELLDQDTTKECDDGLGELDKHKTITQDTKRRNRFHEMKLNLLKAYEKLNEAYPECLSLLSLQNYVFSQNEIWTSKLLATERLKPRMSRIGHAISMANEIAIMNRQDCNLVQMDEHESQEGTTLRLMREEAERTKIENQKLIEEIKKLKSQGTAGTGSSNSSNVGSNTSSRTVNGTSTTLPTAHLTFSKILNENSVPVNLHGESTGFLKDNTNDFINMATTINPVNLKGLYAQSPV